MIDYVKNNPFKFMSAVLILVCFSRVRWLICLVCLCAIPMAIKTMTPNHPYPRFVSIVMLIYFLSILLGNIAIALSR
ncbi:MAG TPA: hypothetical protein GX529_04035 [Firmicutes bacterium]|nr:hypothetical protein [Candidatus Fermentithermobacillaceae bacterium]